MGAILRPRRGTKAVADSKNFVLAKGEIFFEVPSGGVGKGLGRIKMGDGSTAYKNLPYFQELDLIAATGLDNTSKSTIRTNIGAGTSNLALGTSSSTAYRGDYGNTAYTHSQSTHARTDATAVAASSTNGKIKINGTETTVYTHPGSGTNPHGTTKSDVGLGNVGNFKAVSTVASQGLTDTEKSNARANIGAGTSSLALGTTSSTAYRGDYGNTAYTHSQSAHARTDATCVAASSTNGKIKINGTETTVYTHPSGTNPHGTTKSDVGLGNVGNFLAVSTASQSLTNAQKTQARTNIAAASAADVTQLNNEWVAFIGNANSEVRIWNAEVYGDADLSTLYLSSTYKTSKKGTKLLFKQNGLYMTYLINGVNQWEKFIPWDLDEKFTEFHFDDNHRPYLYNAKGIGAGNENELFVGSYEIDTTNYSYLFFSPKGEGQPGMQMNYLKNNQLVTNKYMYWHNDWHGGRYVVNVNQNQNYTTPIPINNLSGGGAILLLWSLHWSDGNNTGAGIILIRTGYNGNNMEISPLHTLGLSTGQTYTDFFTITNDGGYIKITALSSTGAGRFCFYHCM